MKIKVLNEKEVDINIGEESLNRYKLNRFQEELKEGETIGEYSSVTKEDTTFREIIAEEITVDKGTTETQLNNKPVDLTAGGINKRSLDYIGVNDVKLEGEEGAENAVMKGNLGTDNTALSSKREANAVELDREQVREILTQTKIESGVGNQDKEPGEGNLGDTMLTTLKNMGTSVFGGGKIVNEVQGLIDDFKDAGTTVEVDSKDLKLNEYDRHNTKLSQWKSQHFKTIHTDDWNENPFLNQDHNNLNNMRDDYKGELGKSNSVMSNGFGSGNAWARLGGDALNMLGAGGIANAGAQIAGSFGAGGGDAGDASWQSDIDEITNLATVTKDTIYTNKPGMRFKAHYSDGMVENITGRNNWGAVDYRNERNATQAIRTKTKEKLDAMKEKPEWYTGINEAIFRQKQSEYSFSENGGVSKYSWKISNNNFSASEPSEEDMRLITFLRNRNTFNKHLGYLYIRPFYNGYNEGQSGNKDNTADKTNIYNNLEKGFRFFDIPFEFNPEISESATQANYASESLLGRLGQFHVYTGTNLPTLSLTLTYIALAPDALSDEDNNRLGAQFSTDSWQYFWTNNKIEEIELKLRSLVFADYVSADYIIKPPIVELHLENENGQDFDKIGDLFKYPNGIAKEEGGGYYLDKDVGKSYLEFSTVLHDGEDSNRYKKYIVTSVQIDKISQDADFIFPSLYGRKYNSGLNGNPLNHLTLGAEDRGFAGYTRKRGFKATLSLQEVTENFLDLVPDFKAYYDAWVFKQQQSNAVNQVAAFNSGDMNFEMFQKVESILTGDLESLNARLSNGEEKLNRYYEEFEKSFKLYTLATKRIKGRTNNLIPLYLYNNPESRDAKKAFAWRGTANFEPKINTSRINEIPNKSNLLTGIKAEEMPYDYDFGTTMIEPKLTPTLLKLDKGVQGGASAILVKDIYDTISENDTLSLIEVPSGNQNTNMKEIITNVDHLTSCMEKLKDKYEELQDFDKDAMDSLTYKDTIRDITGGWTPGTSNRLDFILAYYRKSFDNDVEKIRFEIQIAVDYFVNDKAGSGNNTFTIETEGWQKPNEDNDKKAYNKFKKIKSYNDLIKFLDPLDVEKFKLIRNSDNTRIPFSDIEAMNFMTNVIKGEQVADDIENYIKASSTFREPEEKRKILLDNMKAIAYEGEFRTIVKYPMSTNADGSTFKVPKLPYLLQNDQIIKYVDIKEIKYDNKVLEFYDFVPNQTRIFISTVKDYINTTGAFYNRRYLDFKNMIEDPNIKNLVKGTPSNWRFDTEQFAAVETCATPNDVLNTTKGIARNLLITENKTFEDEWYLWHQVYNKDHIKEKINEYFHFEQNSDESTDVWEKNNKTWDNVIPSEYDPNGTNAIAGVGKVCYYCYRMKDGEYTLKADQFTDDRDDYNEATNHGKIYLLQVAKSRIEDAQADLSKATNPNAVKNYNKLSG